MLFNSGSSVGWSHARRLVSADVAGGVGAGLADVVEAHRLGVRGPLAMVGPPSPVYPTRVLMPSDFHELNEDVGW